MRIAVAGNFGKSLLNVVHRFLKNASSRETKHGIVN